MEGAAEHAPPGHSAPRLVEVVAAFSLASDLGLGQPMEHGLRSCVIATRIAETLDLVHDERTAIYWVTLLGMVGCTGDSHELSEIFGDDIELRHGLFAVGPSEGAMLRYFLSRAGSDGGVLRRTEAASRLILSGMRSVMAGFVADCAIASRFADRLSLGESVSGPLTQKFARWDGKGIPRGLRGEQIALAARVLSVSWRLESENRLRGVEAAAALLQRHAGATLDPEIVAAVVPALTQIVDGLEEESWATVVAAEPARATLTGATLENVLESLGDFADLKSPWFTGHSRAVAELAEAAAWRLGVAEPDVTRLRHAALVHSIGRSGVPNTIWDKRGPLSVAEHERMQLYPYLTDRILRRANLASLADTASASQERLDGSGYARGLSGGALPPLARLLAAADVYQALCESRPHRPPLAPEAAAGELRAEVREGRVDAEAAEAVLGAAGHLPQRAQTAPDDLTAREVEVLRLIARGRTSAEVATELGISAKTVGAHIGHIYSKIDASNRSVATLYAMQHGLV